MNRHFHVAVMCCHYTTTTCLPVFPGCQDSLQSACASSPSLALSPVTAWGVVYPALYHLSLKPVLHWRGRAESNCRCILSVRRMEPPCPLPSHASLPCCRCTTSTCARSVPASSVAQFRFATAFSESARSLFAMRYACPAGCTLYTAWFGSWCGRVESNHLSYRTNTVHKPCSCLLPHMAPARLADTGAVQLSARGRGGRVGAAPGVANGA